MDQLLWGQTMSNFAGSIAEKTIGIQALNIALPIACRNVHIVLSNRYGTRPLCVESACVQQIQRQGEPGDDELLAAWGDPGANPEFLGKRAVTFAGAFSVSIAPGETAASDTVHGPFEVGYLRISLDPAQGQTGVTLGSGMDRTAFGLEGVDDENQFYWGIESVWGQTDSEAAPICFFGDSLTNQGRYSGPASRILWDSNNGVITYNCGISGNRLLHDADGDSLWTPSFGDSAISRFERDVTFGGKVMPRVIFAFLGVNDLYQAGAGAPSEQLPSAGEIPRGLEALRAKAQELGTSLILGTVTPFKGSVGRCLPAWSPQKEALRIEANEYIRSLPDNEWVDTDALVRDADDPSCLNDMCDSGDHLHFSQDGGEVVGSAVAEAIIKTLKS